MRNSVKYILFVWAVVHRIEDINSTTEDSSDGELDNFINDYVNEVRRTLKVGLDPHVINKRSQPNIDLYKLTGLELLVGFREMYSIPTKLPHDLVIFTNCQPNQQQLYSVALESQNEDIHNTKLVLYKYQGGKWYETHRVAAAGGKNIAIKEIGDSVYFVVAQYLTSKNLSSTVWRLPSGSDTLQYVHMLYTHLASHAIMWTDTYTYQTYAAVAISENEVGLQQRFATKSPVYQWLGNSFDMIDTLPTNNPRALVQFNIHSSMFVAVANFQNDLGETVIDSEIFRYNPATGKFNLYQKLPTEAAVDIKYFCFQSNHITESFLIYASAFHTDEKGNKDYDSPSVVYKLSDEKYFVPFQALRVSKVSSWLPVRHVKNGLESLTLVGASEEGIISLQYDGWRFVPTGLHYDESTFGPGPKSLNAFYSDDQVFISVANQASYDYKVNVFSPVFKPNPSVENLQKTISEWVKEMTQQLIEGESKMSELTRIVREAPKVNDSIIVLGSRAEFRNIDVHKLETFETTVGDSNPDAEVCSKLNTLKNNLDSLNQRLVELPDRIDGTNHHTKAVFEDVIENSADIFCNHSCVVEELLEVNNINGENLSSFFENTINIKEPVEFQGEITFNDLALIEQLNTKTINGHMKETLIDWSKEVVLHHKMKVDGDVFAKDSVSVSDAVDGVLINDVEQEETFEPGVITATTREFESLNTSQLLLSDGKLSEVNFRNFADSTLKTHGDQTFSVFQDISRIEADEVTADLFKAVSPLHTLSQQRSCVDEDCSEDRNTPHGNKPRARSSAGKHGIESIKLLNNVIIIPRNVTLFGTVIIENGSLSSKDFVDLGYNVSAVNISNFAIPLNQSEIEQHFRFDGELEAPSLNVDTLNSLPLTSFVDLKETDNVRLTGSKTFEGSVAVDGTLHMAGTINGLDLKQLEEVEEDLEQVEFDYFTAKEINSTSIMLGENSWRNLAIIIKDGIVVFKTLNVKENVRANSVMVRRNINNYNLEKLLNDTVFEGDDNLIITGPKHFVGQCEIKNLNVNSSNGMNVQFSTPENLWKKRLMQAKKIEVEKLFYTGKLDGVEAREFGRWLLTEGEQSVTASNDITSLQALDVTMSPNATFNSINITHLFTQALLVNDNTTFERVVFDDVHISELEVGGKINGLEVPSDIVLADPSVDQLVAGHKRVLGSVFVDGDLHTFGLMSDVNITAYCQALDSNNSRLILSGDGTFKQEPEILISVNNIEWSDMMRNVWFKDNNVTILAKVLMGIVEFENLAVKKINNNDIEEELSRLVSLSKDQDINGTFYFSDVIVKKGLKADEAKVGGDVQGIKLPSFINNVLLNGVNQEIEAYFDIATVIIENEFDNMGLINGLNFSSDLMLLNVTSNTVKAQLTVNNLKTTSLKLPPGASVAGVDLNLWSTTAINKSGPNNVITGNLVITGQLDTSQGIRVKNLVNGLPFDQSHVLLSSGSQEISGKKRFSSKSNLIIHKLQVKGFLNDINITEFYCQQVTARGDVSMSGQKMFTVPIWSERVVLPEIYQSYNLTWLEHQLSSPLPWSSYQGQQTIIQQHHQLASRCLAGRAYYLKNITRERDLDGDVLFTFALKSGNVSALAVARRDADATRLSLLYWSQKQNMFLHIPGSFNTFLRVVPSKVQMITLPGGELAAYITYMQHNETPSVEHGDLIRLKDGQITQTIIHRGKPGSTLLSFLHKSRTCFIVVADKCRVYCHEEGQPTYRLPSFSCRNITKATLFTTDRGPYVLGIRFSPQVSLLLWRLSGRKFTLVVDMPLFNPISLAATTTTGPHIAVANLHLLGHSHPETVDIYRFDESTSRLELEQSLTVVSPQQLVFSSLPTSESVLYVASDVPASPLQVYIYRGILGYQLLATDVTLPTPLDIQPFTDHHQQHLLVIPSAHMASVLKANFEGLA